MKQQFFLGLTLLFSLVVNAQINTKLKNEEYSSAIKFNLISPIVSAIAFQYEKSLTKDASFIVTASYFTGQISKSTETIRGISTCLEYRYYLDDKFMSGYYLQPFIRFQYFKDISTKTDELSVPGVGLLVGYQKILLKRLCFDMNFGPVYNFGELTSPTNNYGKTDLRPMFKGYWMRGGVSIGYLIN